LNWWKLFLRVNTRRERKKWKIKKFSFLSIALCTPSAFEELWNLKIFPLVLAQISCLQHWSWRYMWENVILHEIDSIYQRDISRSIILARIIYLVFVGFNFWNFKFVLVSISTKMRKKISLKFLNSLNDVFICEVNIQFGIQNNFQIKYFLPYFFFMEGKFEMRNKMPIYLTTYNIECCWIFIWTHFISMNNTWMWKKSLLVTE
jgi:hypothetical protein